MNKNELVEAVVAVTQLSKKDAGNAVSAVFDTVTASVAAGQDVKIAGFGTFSRTSRAARTGRNPATGETLQIPASNGVKLKAAKALKEAVN